MKILEKMMEEKVLSEIQKRNRSIIYKILFATILFGITYFIVLKSSKLNSDFGAHIITADEWSKSNVFSYFLYNSYPIWHVLTKIASKLLSLPIEYAAAVVTGMIEVLTYFCALIFVKAQEAIDYLVMFFIMLVGPIYLPWYNIYYYQGQGTPNTWHNPTNMVVKPIMILSIMVLLKILQFIEENKKITLKLWIASVFLTTLSVFAKPSYLQGIIPALAIYFFVKLVLCKFKFFKGYLLVALSFIPAVLAMLRPYLLYFNTNDGNGIEIAWFDVIKQSAPNLLVSYILPLAFPILYICTNFQSLKKQRDIHLMVAFELVSYLELIMLAETGFRRYNGNFCWTHMLALTIIWLIVGKYFLGDLKKWLTGEKELRKMDIVTITLFLIHLFEGVRYVTNLIWTEDMWL